MENRLRYPIEVFEAMRAVWPEEKPMSVRVSASDWKEGGLSEEDLIAISEAYSDGSPIVHRTHQVETFRPRFIGTFPFPRIQLVSRYWLMIP